MNKREDRCISVVGENVCFRHGRKQRPALDNINISVQKGIIYGLLGPSGCGKTTLLRCIVGRLKPESGVIRVFGRIPGENGFCIPGRGVGYMPQDLSLYPEITPEEILIYFGRLFQMSYSSIAERSTFLLALLDIPNKKTLIRNLSGGQKRRVSFAVALIHKPPLLILDEPTVGVDPLLRRSIWRYLNQLANEDNLTVMITTHYVEEARQADQVGLMREGRLLVQMNPENLMKRYNALTLENVFLEFCVKDSCTQNNVMGNGNGVQINGITKIRHRYLKMLDNQEGSNHSAVELKAVASHTAEINQEAEVQKEATIGFLFETPSIGGKLKESGIRMLALVVKSFMRLKRNIPLVFFQIFVPLLQITVFCLCIGGEPYNLPIAVSNMERSPTKFGQRFLNTLSNRTFEIRYYTNLSLAIDSVKNGETWGAVHIGPLFTKNLIRRFLEGMDANNVTITESQIHLYLDMTNQPVATTIYETIFRGFQDFFKVMLEKRGYNPLLADPPVLMEDPIYGKRKNYLTEFMAPGLVLSIIYLVAIGLTAMTVITEKKDGLLERSLVAGVSPGEILFTILFHLFVTMILQIVLVIAIAFYAFDIKVTGAVLWVYICTALVGFSGMTLGLLISCICPEENSAMMVAMGVYFPNTLLSGTIWPIESIPRFLKYISYALPMTVASRTMRSLISRGWGILDHNIWHGLLINVAWSAISIILTWLIFKSRRFS